MKKILSITLGLLLMLPGALCAQDASKGQGGTELELKSPITLESANIFRDGGSIGLGFRDALGKELVIAMDARFGVPKDEHCLYIGAKHPTIEGAVRVERDSDMEKKIHGILINWKNQQTADHNAALVYRVLEFLENR